MKIIRKSTAPYIMAVLAMLFGLNYVWQKFIVDGISPYVILFYANVGGLLVTSIIAAVKKISLKVGVKQVFIANFIFLLTHIFELTGIRYTTSSNASFIMQVSVLSIPILSAAADKRAPDKITILFGLAALTGIGIMTLDPQSLSLNKGDILILIAALCFSAYIILLERISHKINVVAIVFNYFLIGVFLYFTLAAATAGVKAVVIPFTDFAFMLPFLAYTVTSLLALLVQVQVAEFIRPDAMAIYYCLEPVATLIAAYLLLSESVTPQMAAGGTIIIASILLSSYLKRKKMSPAL